MTLIREIGRVTHPDENGELTQNVSSFSLVVSPWKEAVADLVEAYKEHFGERLYALYLRGSVARGEATEEVSDIDTLGILGSENRSADNLWQSESKAMLERRYPFTKIDCAYLSLRELLTSERKTGIHILLRTQGLLLTGQDVLHLIPTHKPDVHTLEKLSPWLPDEVMIAPNRLASLVGNERKQYIRFLMKQFLRGAFLLVMPREYVFTRDLYPCYKLFSKHYPEHEPQAKQVLEWALEPPTEAAAVAQLVETFGNWIINERKRILNGIK